MIFLIAMRKVLAFELPRQYIRDTMTDIVQTMYVKPVEHALAHATEAEKSHLEQKLKGWQELIHNPVFEHTVSQIIPNSASSEYEDYIINGIVALWATRDNLTTKVDPIKGNPKDLVNWFRPFMSGKIKDQVRKALGRGEKYKAPKTVSLDAPHGDDKGTRIIDYIENHGKGTVDRDTQGEYDHLLHQFKGYIKSKDKNGVMQKLMEVWMKEVEEDINVNFEKVVPLLAAHFDIAESTVYAAYRDFKQLAAHFFQHELKMPLTQAVKESLHIANDRGYLKMADKLAMEISLTREHFRKAAARYVLGGVYSDLMSGDYQTPEAMIEEVRS